MQKRASPLAPVVPVIDPQRHERDLELWKAWKASDHSPELLKPLITQFNSTIQKRISTYQGRVPLPPAVVETEVLTQFVDALQSYNPSRKGALSGRSASLNTHVFNRLRKSGRFIKRYQNVGSIPEKRIDQITNYRTVKSEMTELLGREPSQMELSEKLHWSPAEVSRMESEDRKDLLVSTAESSEFGDPVKLMPSRHREVISLMKYELSPQELQVMQYSMGLEGKPKLGTGAIASKLGRSAPTVSRIKGRILKRIQEYVGDEF